MSEPLVRVEVVVSWRDGTALNTSTDTIRLTAKGECGEPYDIAPAIRDAIFQAVRR